MDNASAHSSLPPEPSDRKLLFSAIAWVGVILIFVFIVIIAYVLPQRQSRDYGGALYDDVRTEIRDKVFSSQEQAANAYRWVNQGQGVVRIPIERAKGLIVEELQAAGNGSAE